jgi:hypothetical protein
MHLHACFGSVTSLSEVTSGEPLKQCLDTFKGA